MGPPAFNNLRKHGLAGPVSFRFGRTHMQPCGKRLAISAVKWPWPGRVPGADAAGGLGAGGEEDSRA